MILNLPPYFKSGTGGTPYRVAAVEEPDFDAGFFRNFHPWELVGANAADRWPDELVNLPSRGKKETRALYQRNNGGDDYGEEEMDGDSGDHGDVIDENK